MLGSFIVLFRESFEAALIVGIILSFLKRSGQAEHIKTVGFGVLAAIIISIVTGIIFLSFSMSFEGATEQIFEGITMLVTALLLSTLIVYMMRVKPSGKAIEGDVKQQLLTGSAWGLFALVFFSVYREGVETVLFLVGLNLTDGLDGIGGAVLGLAAGIGLVYLIFKGIVRLNFGMLFNVTNALLILIASGLVAHGVHELQEVGWIPTIVAHVWDINHLLDEKSQLGTILKGVFGYNGNPSLIEVLSYVVFMAVVIVAGKMPVGNKGKLAAA